MSDIHPTAIVEDGVTWGTGVRVGPHAVIQKGAVIGDGCMIGPGAVITGWVDLGAECRVHAQAVLGDDPQDLAFAGTPSTVQIGRGCRIREGVTIHRGTEEGSVTRIGEECYLMSFSHFAHNVTLGNRVIVVSGALIAGYVEIGDGAFVSGNATIHQFCRIGRLAMVGGNAGITQDLAPFCTARSVSLNTLAGLNVVGMKRAGFAPEVRKEIKRAFHILFQSGLNTPDAVARIRDTLTASEARELADFAAAGTRGLCRM